MRSAAATVGLPLRNPSISARVEPMIASPVAAASESGNGSVPSVGQNGGELSPPGPETFTMTAACAARICPVLAVRGSVPSARTKWRAIFSARAGLPSFSPSGGLCRIARRKSPRAAGIASRQAIECAPADWPNIVTFSGSPPKAAMFSLTQRSAAS